MKVITLSAGFVLGGAGAYWIGKRTGDAEVRRLQIVWPNLLSLPSKDRIFLGTVSKQCGLEHVPMDGEAVVGCLRGAVERRDLRVPRGVLSAPGELDRLLRESAVGSHPDPR